MISMAWFCRMVERSASSAWLCCRARRRASSSVMCGAAAFARRGRGWRGVGLAGGASWAEAPGHQGHEPGDEGNNIPHFADTS